MRLRIQSYSPLPDVKAWFVPDVQNVPESILDLKILLCRRVHAFKEGGVHASNVALFVEDFELLDDCPFGAVRDGDLVCVKMVGPVGVLKGEVAMELDPPEMEGVFLLSWWKVLLIGRIFERTDSCQQKAETIATNVDARTGCPEIAHDSAVVEEAH